MSRQKSSSLARINDLAKTLISEVDNAIAEHDILMAANERLKDIEPALAKLQAALKPATIEPATGETPTPESVLNTGIGIEIIPPVKTKRIRKKKGTIDQGTPPTEPD